MAYTGSLQKYTVPPLDPNAYTGPTRVMAGVARTGNITVDTPYNTSGNAEFARWLYLGTSGSVSYVKWDGSTQILVGLASGIWHPIYSILVNSVGTTATSMVWGS